MINRNSICLLVFAIFLAFTSAQSVQAAPEVEANAQSYWMNLITLFHVQNMMFWCLMGSFTSLFWGDGGSYYRRCFANFVAKPVFY